MKRVSICYILLLSVFNFVYSQNNLTINGVAQGFEGRNVRIVTYADQISYLEKTVAKTIVDTDGKFTLDFILPYTTFAMLCVDNSRAEIYLKPNSIYKIRVFSLDDSPNNYSSLRIKYNIDFEIVDAGPQELNDVIAKFNSIYNEFVLDSFHILYGSRSNLPIDRLRRKLKDTLREINSDYFDNYVKYRLALLEATTKKKSFGNLLKQYIFGQPILYGHIEYMELFNQLFTKYVLAGSRAINLYDLDSVINVELSYFDLLNLIGRDSLLINEVIREMVMLKSAFELFYTKGFKRSAIIKILRDFSKYTKFPEHKEIAKNLIFVLTRLQPDSKAPEFTLKEYGGGEVSLKNLKGNFVYLSFFSTKCIPCLAEYKIMNNLEEKFRHSIEFISISVDNSFLELSYYLEKNVIPRTVLYYDQDMDLLNDYEVRSLPLFVLIDKQGRIIHYPAKMPSENVESVLIQLIGGER